MYKISKLLCQQLDNEDVAIHKLLANLQGKDYEGPVPLTSKRIRKTV